METQTVKYLLIEHLPLLTNGYESAMREIAHHQPNILFKGEMIDSLEGIYIQDLVKKDNYQYILINLDFSQWKNQTYKTPLAFLIYIRKEHPEIRIMMSLQRATVYAFREIYTKITPDCIVEITDCTPKTIYEAITHLLESQVFYSKTILDIFQIFIKANHSLDAMDYGILYELSVGTPINKLPYKIHLAPTTIFKRKINLKIFFNVEGQTDRELIKKAKQQRFI